MREPGTKNSPSPPPNSLILIGTVHGDPKGYERAWKLLEHLRPELITVEISRFSLNYRRRQEKRWVRLFEQALEELPPSARGHLAIQRVAAQVALPFEVRVARDWCRDHGISWLPVDLSAPARRHLPRYSQEVLSPANIKTLLATGDGFLEDFVAGEFHRAALAFQRPPWRLYPQAPPEALKRERFLARRLKQLVAAGRRVVHLGGWEHLVPWRDGTGLTHRLADLHPLRLLLKDAANIASGGDG
ncbi:MAG: hypothetical protein Q8M54_00845 [Desulfobaccales bacterium]|nr:hypothetical protein [Desulfobaccales bacterium]